MLSFSYDIVLLSTTLFYKTKKKIITISKIENLVPLVFYILSLISLM